jgi:hypothetical protein
VSPYLFKVQISGFVYVLTLLQVTVYVYIYRHSPPYYFKIQNGTLFTYCHSLRLFHNNNNITCVKFTTQVIDPSAILFTFRSLGLCLHSNIITSYRLKFKFAGPTPYRFLFKMAVCLRFVLAWGFFTFYYIDYVTLALCHPVWEFCLCFVASGIVYKIIITLPPFG